MNVTNNIRKLTQQVT